MGNCTSSETQPQNNNNNGNNRTPATKMIDAHEPTNNNDNNNISSSSSRHRTGKCTEEPIETRSEDKNPNDPEHAKRGTRQCLPSARTQTTNINIGDFLDRRARGSGEEGRVK